MDATSRQDDATALCLACGMCCDGSLFAHLDLDEGDRKRLAGAGDAVPTRVSQPCRFFASDRCGVYAARPSRCRSFRCKVLEALERGDTTLESALELVSQARQRSAELSLDLPPGTPMARIAEAVPSPGEARRPEELQLLARYVALRSFVERHFLSASSHFVRRGPVNRR
jgi:Fe-S-cluster containining protein